MAMWTKVFFISIAGGNQESDAANAGTESDDSAQHTSGMLLSMLLLALVLPKAHKLGELWTLSVAITW